MAKRSLVEQLREILFFEDVDQEDLEKLSDIGRLVAYRENEVVFREADPAEHVYFVVEGSVALQMCSPGKGCRNVLTLGPGEILGWSVILGETHLTATARTTMPTSLIEVHGGLLLTLCDHNPRLGHEIMRRTASALAKRLSAARMQLLDIFGGFESLPMPPADEGAGNAG